MDPGRSSGLWFVLLLTPSRRRCAFHLQPVAFREVRPHSQRRDRKGIAPFSLDPSLFRNCLLNVDAGRAEVKSFLAHLDEVGRLTALRPRSGSRPRWTGCSWEVTSARPHGPLPVAWPKSLPVSLWCRLKQAQPDFSGAQPDSSFSRTSPESIPRRSPPCRTRRRGSYPIRNCPPGTSSCCS